MKHSIDVTFELNGRSVTVTDVPPLQRLLDTLREELRVTGTKEGCGEGECGACTVLIDGLPVNSCLVPVVQLGGTRIVSVEGLGEGEQLSTLQRVFVEAGGAQCGICTPRHPARRAGLARQGTRALSRSYSGGYRRELVPVHRLPAHRRRHRTGRRRRARGEGVLTCLATSRYITRRI